MTTFSQLIDAVVAETRRPDLLPEIAAYANQTIREVHSEPARGNAVMYSSNFREKLLLANTMTGFGWDSDPATFQAMQVVKYLASGEYPREKVPSRALQGQDLYYYRAGNRFVFSGYGGVNGQIAIGYYEFPRRLKYYPVASRPATYDSDTGWTYLSTFADTVEGQEGAEALTSNWILLRWMDVILEGLRAKVYKRVGDEARAKLCYSLYMTGRQNLYSSESADLGG